MRKPVTQNHIAPCGMNCAVCRAFLRPKNKCKGCGYITEEHSVSRINCRLRTCKERKNGFCFDCNSFPCKRLKQLDKRFRLKYGMSEIGNLEFIRDHGIVKFLERENKRWVSGKLIFCVHDQKYYPIKKNEKDMESKNRR